MLAEIAADLDETVRALRALQSADDDKRRDGGSGIEDVLRRGNAGRVRVPGKHGTAPTAYEIVAVLIGDQPGELARLFADAGRGRGQHRGRAHRARHRAAGRPGAADGASQAAPRHSTAALRERGWSIRQ